MQRERPLDVKTEVPRPAPRRFERPEQGAPGEHRSDERHRRPFGDEERGGPRHEEQRERPRPHARDAEGLVTYRIEVGHRHGATPREIVGAIANESGLEGRFIGRIDIRDDHALVDLPDGMPREIFNHLQRVFVRGQALRISRADRDAASARRPEGGWSTRETRESAPRPHRKGDEGSAPRFERSSFDRKPREPGSSPDRRRKRGD
jgi:ATP-dependent RNA helicase DeaD